VQTRFQSGEEPTADSRNIRMFCHSTGADNDRPLKFERDSRGQWRITEFSSMCLGVRPPKDPKAVDF